MRPVKTSPGGIAQGVARMCNINTFLVNKYRVCGVTEWAEARGLVMGGVVMFLLLLLKTIVGSASTHSIVSFGAN